MLTREWDETEIDIISLARNLFPHYVTVNYKITVVRVKINRIRENIAIKQQIREASR